MSEQPPTPPESGPSHGSVPPTPPPGQNPYGPPASGHDPYATPAGGQNPYASAAPGAPLTAAEDRQWATFAHFGGVLAVLALVSGWAGLLAVVPALVIFLVFGKRGALTRDESREALNFQITIVGAIVVWAIISNVIVAAMWALPLGIILAISAILAIVGWALVILDVVFSILAGVRVNRGGTYRYPFALRLVK